MARIVPTALAAGLPSLLGGCCTLAELWCGPDRSKWVSVSFESPAAALATFKEAARRDDSFVVFRCLGERWKRQMGIGGSFEAALAWELFKQQATGVHLLGNAHIVEGPEFVDPNRVRFVLERAGYRVELLFVQQIYWEVAYTDQGEVISDSDFIESFARHLHIDATDAEAGDYRLRVGFDADLGVPGLDRATVQRAGVFREWKIDGLRDVTAD